MSAGWLLPLIHVYIGWRIAPHLPGLAATSAFVALLMASALLIPMAFFGRRMPERAAADRWTWIGMLALGQFSMLLVLTLLRDLLLLLLFATPFSVPAIAEASAAAVPLLALAATLVGLIEARRTASVRDVDVPIAGLPTALQGFTIVQISDLHVGPTVKAPYVRAIVDRVNRLGADAIAITGDLVDGRVQDLAADVAPLASLRSRHGTYFVTGNHEYYSGAPEWIAQLRTIGLRVLLDEHVVIEHEGSRLVLAGVADFNARHFVSSHRSDPRAAIAGAPGDAGLRVLLAHQPRSASAAAEAGFDVQLSGHTHGGQFWPWNLLVKLQQPFVAGLERLGSLWVYTSRGTGYWGPPLRLGAPSEITRLRFVASRGP
ncbi:MAG: metallophosphoesterase [Pseudomonadota bacterium]